MAKANITCLLFMLVSLYVNGQVASTENNVTDSSNKIYTENLGTEASFPGGLNKWTNFLKRNLRTLEPVENGAPGGIYNVIVEFVVSKDGKISDIKALTNYGYGMEKEVIRLIKISRKWIPATIDGKPVNAIRRQPVTFAIFE